jgi:outer membrane immunogenic protein
MSYISRKLAQSAVVIGLISAPVTALAADFAPPPVGKAIPYVAPLQYRWDGFYVGINGGGAFGQSVWSFAGNTGFDTSAWLIGATLGWNTRWGGLVVGIEGDFDYTGSSFGRTTQAGCVAGCSLTSDYLATVRGRIGYALDRFLPYFTAGGAVGRLTTQTVVASNDEWRMGYAVGAGIEMAAMDSLTVKAEYMFVDLGNFTCSPSCGPAGSKASYYTNLYRLGLNYHF